jgi:cell division protein DivIC
VNLRRVFFSLYLLFLGGLGLAAGLFFLDAREEYDRLKTDEAQYRRRLAEEETQLAEQEKELERLRSDPVYVEKVIRRNLRYAKPDETLFNFEQ